MGVYGASLSRCGRSHSLPPLVLAACAVSAAAAMAVGCKRARELPRPFRSEAGRPQVGGRSWCMVGVDGARGNASKQCAGAHAVAGRIGGAAAAKLLPASMRSRRPIPARQGLLRAPASASEPRLPA
jgi:hypothetical protein